ncbi:MAG: phosphoenolpyruvate carboxylase, partial [Deltaproteobacteria bacterium]
MDALCAQLDAKQAAEVVRAFTSYFQLVNLGEDVERTRVIRRRQIEGRVLEESLDWAVGVLAEAGASREEVLEVLSELRLTFVFTAHPTEARRRTTERLLAQVKDALVDLDRRVLTPIETQATLRHMRAAIEALWEHSVERSRRPDVLDEVKAGLWYLEKILMDQVPRLARRIHRALCRHYGAIDLDAVPLPVRFGSWMGSDRDGNPYVTDAITERTLELQRRSVLGRYLRDLDALADHLAAHEARLEGLEELSWYLERAGRAVPEVTDAA